MSSSSSQRFDSNEASHGGIQYLGNRDVHIYNRQPIESELLKTLPCVADAGFGSAMLERERYCLPDTRVKLLELINDWIHDPNAQHIFWLRGMAGTGKSTVARTVARDCAEKGQLGGSFFFSRAKGDLEDGSKLFSTLAHQLIQWDRYTGNYGVADSILKAATAHPDITQRAKVEQWKQLILRPLSQIQMIDTLVVFVIDALDESENQNDVDLIIRALADIGGLNRTQLRILLTSRPEVSIRDGFCDISESLHRDFVLHDIEQHIIQHDLYVFFKHEFESIKKKRSVSDPFPGETVIDTLVKRAGGLFIYAATVCLFVSDTRGPHTKKRLDIIIESDIAGTSAVHNLDLMYTQILQQPVSEYPDEEGKQDFYLQFQQTIGPIVTLFSPLSSLALAGLLFKVIDEVRFILNGLQSVLNVPQLSTMPISLLHPSFRDFLLNRERCVNRGFFIDEAKQHRNLTSHCLRLMTTHLKRDICGLRLIGTLLKEADPKRIQDSISAELQYACIYWIRHLESFLKTSEENEKEILDEIYTFLRIHVLHWFEVLGLLEKISQAAAMLSTLRLLVKVIIPY
jgi:hypothetical protein